MKLLSIQIGKPKIIQWDGKEVSTGIFKSKVAGPIWVRHHNLDGDGQADLGVHGGRDKAVYAYGFDAYSWWKKTLNQDLPGGAFGENLTVETLDEKTLGIGDVLDLGDCRLQITEPRFPCFKLGIKFNDVKILKTFIESGRPGIYFRVLKEGQIRPGDSLKMVERHAAGVSVDTFFRLKIGKLKDRTALEKLLAMDTLGPEWREKFPKLLQKY